MKVFKDVFTGTLPAQCCCWWGPIRMVRLPGEVCGGCGMAATDGIVRLFALSTLGDSSLTHMVCTVEFSLSWCFSCGVAARSLRSGANLPPLPCLGPDSLPAAFYLFPMVSS